MVSPLSGSYSATKHALVGLSTALRVEAASAGIHVSVLCPGAVRTPLLSGASTEFLLPRCQSKNNVIEHSGTPSGSVRWTLDALQQRHSIRLRAIAPSS
ncbi:MAG TPA: SDR family oxidoreductase [Candidatus Binataceae bacterium]|nr:SDR family oxidoreductase [Candidatus Binataceae bacterium]